MWLQKTGMSALAAQKHIAATCGIDVREVGCAGLKDAQATTKQYFSIPATAEGALHAVGSDPRLVVLHAARHTNKLKTGHLRGNRFVIKIRDCHPGAAQRAAALQAHFATYGLSNAFGPQRFGQGGDTLTLGMRLLHGQTRLRRGSLHRLALNAVQAALFNEYLLARAASGLMHTTMPGEVMQVCASGGPFVVDDVAREQARFVEGEVVPAGPIFGPKMRQARGDAWARESAVLQAHALQMGHFAAHKKLMQGTRRAIVVRLPHLALQVFGSTTELHVTLPPGSYATVLLNELGAHV